MPLHDFRCPSCGEIKEEIVTNGEIVRCDTCGEPMEKVFLKSATHLTTIIPSYPGCKAQKAGYVHTHGDRPATKVQSGFGGCVNPSSK